MVKPLNLEEPNLSYVRVNQGTSAGTGESLKCFITKNMSPSDPAVVNSELLHKSLTDQPVPLRLGTSPLWRPLHLYTEDERRTEVCKLEVWEQLPNVSSTSQKSVLPSSDVVPSSSVSKKRSLQETEELQPAVKKIRLEKINPEEMLKRVEELQKHNASLVVKNRELEQRMNLMTKIMKDPHKLALLTHKLRHANLVKLSKSGSGEATTGKLSPN